MDNIARQIHPAEWKRVTFILFDQFRIASARYTYYVYIKYEYAVESFDIEALFFF